MFVFPNLKIIAVALTSIYASSAVAQNDISTPIPVDNLSDSELEENLRSVLGVQIKITVDGKEGPIDFFTFNCEHPIEDTVNNFHQSLDYNGQEMQITTRAFIYNHQTREYDGTASIIFGDPFTIPKDLKPLPNYSGGQNLLRDSFVAIAEDHLQDLFSSGYIHYSRPPPECALLIG